MVKYIFLALLMLNLSCNPYDKYSKIISDSEISVTVRKHKNDRGGSIINDIYLFDSSCPLISEYSSSDFESMDELYFAFQLVPYVLFKNKNEDFFYVIKEQDTLKFKLLEM